MQKVLLIGAGNMGKVHAKAYSIMDHAELAGIVDMQKDKGQQLAHATGTRYFSSFEEALTTLDQIDVIDICLPTYLHKEFVKRVADEGKNVICEKPLARNLEDAQEIIQYCQDKDVRLFVGHVIRFFHEYQKAHTLLKNGAIGEAAVVRTTRGGIFPTAWNDWYADFQNSGGLVLDMIIHDFDFLRWCFGEIERVFAKSLHGRGFARLDYALVTLRFKSGVIAHVEGSWAHEGFSSMYEFSGTDGIIEYNSAKETPLKANIRNKQQGISGVAVPESPLKESPYFIELRHYIDCLEKKEESIVTTEDAYKAMEISLAAIESIQTGKPVTLNHSVSVASSN
jgi:UDP-N-acetylglucosamine 3-dehydrogenase